MSITTDSNDNNNNNNNLPIVVRNPKAKKEKDKFTKLTPREKDSLRELILDTITYDFNPIQSKQYIEARIGRNVSDLTIQRTRRDIQTGLVSDEWLNQFTRVGFALAHKELLSNAQRSYRTINRKIFELELFIKAEKYREKYEKNKKDYDDLLVRYYYLQKELAREVLQYTLGTPVIAQIKAMINKTVILEERDKLVSEGGMNLKDANMEIMRNIYSSDIKKRNFNIKDTEHNIINNNQNDDPNRQQTSDNILGSTTINLNAREEFIVTGSDTNQSMDDEGSIDESNIQPIFNEDTNYSIPNPEQAEQFEKEFIRRKSKFTV